MRAVDVNLLVFAQRADAPRHDEFRTWLEGARNADEPLGLSDMVLGAFLRIVTHPRIFQDPTPPDLAARFAELLRASPSAIPLTPGPRHWPLFIRLCGQSGARGNQVPDAFMAAMAMEAGATWMTADRGFARFPGLRWAHPLD